MTTPRADHARVAGWLASLLWVLSSASGASAYDRQASLDAFAGWGIAPALADGFPDNGPSFGVGATFGFDDTWAVGVTTAWSIHPSFDGTTSEFHVGQLGVEGLYYLDILQVVPFFGLGIDALPSFDGAQWRADFAAHLRLSLDYLVSREVTVGFDFRPYVVLTALDLDPVYLTFQLRLSYLVDL